MMGLFGKDRAKMPSLGELDDYMDGKIKGIRGFTDKELKEIAAKQRGKISRRGDLQAGLSDLRQGRKGSQGGIKRGDAKKNVPLDSKGNPRSSWW